MVYSLVPLAELFEENQEQPDVPKQNGAYYSTAEKTDDSDDTAASQKPTSKHKGLRFSDHPNILSPTVGAANSLDTSPKIHNPLSRHFSRSMPAMAVHGEPPTIRVHSPSNQSLFHNSIHERMPRYSDRRSTTPISEIHLRRSESTRSYIPGTPLCPSPVPGIHDPDTITPIPRKNGSLGWALTDPKSGIMVIFKLKLLCRFIYYILLFHLPMFYFHRVARVFKEADMCADDLKQAAISNWMKNQRRPSLFSVTIRTTNHTRRNLQTIWEDFIDSSIREWKTTNIVSVMLLPSIVGTLQINAALADVIIRTVLFTSLLCALMSLIYGCIYIVRFASMRPVHKAVEWAAESEQSEAAVFWNVWVLLAMPAAWLAWSLIMFVTAITIFFWRYNPMDSVPITTVVLGVKIAARCVVMFTLTLGVIHLILIIYTLNQYGTKLDERWKIKVQEAALKRPLENLTYMRSVEE